MRNVPITTTLLALSVPFVAAACVIVSKPAETAPAASATAPAATATTAATPVATAPAATTGGARVIRLPRVGGTPTGTTTGTAPVPTTTGTTPVPTTTTTTTAPVPTASTVPVTQQQCVAPLVWDGTKCTYSLPPGGRPPGM